MLVQPVIPDGTVIRTQDGGIWFVEHNRLRHIPDPQTFGNMGLEASDIKNPSAEQLASIKEGDMLPHLDTRLIRKRTGEIYLLVKGFRRHVPDPVTLQAVQAGQPVITVPPDVLDAFPEGPPLPAAAPRK